jgi:hypothetical protein
METFDIANNFMAFIISRLAGYSTLFTTVKSVSFHSPATASCATAALQSSSVTVYTAVIQESEQCVVLFCPEKKHIIPSYGSVT